MIDMPINPQILVSAAEDFAATLGRFLSREDREEKMLLLQITCNGDTMQVHTHLAHYAPRPAAKGDTK